MTSLVIFGDGKAGAEAGARAGAGAEMGTEGAGVGASAARGTEGAGAGLGAKGTAVKAEVNVCTGVRKICWMMKKRFDERKEGRKEEREGGKERVFSQTM